MPQSSRARLIFCAICRPPPQTLFPNLAQLCPSRIARHAEPPRPTFGAASPGPTAANPVSVRVRFPILPSTPFHRGQHSPADTSPWPPPAIRRMPPVQELADDLPTRWGKGTRLPFAFPRLTQTAKDGRQRSRCDTPVPSPESGTYLPLRPFPPVEIQRQASLPPRE